MAAQKLFQALMQQMGRRVAAADAAAADSLHPGNDRGALLQSAALDGSLMDDLSRGGEKCAGDQGTPFRCGGGDRPAVADLPPLFGVEGGAIKKYLYGIALGGSFADFPVDQEQRDR